MLGLRCKCNIIFRIRSFPLNPLNSLLFLFRHKIWHLKFQINVMCPTLVLNVSELGKSYLIYFFYIYKITISTKYIIGKKVWGWWCRKSHQWATRYSHTRNSTCTIKREDLTESTVVVSIKYPSKVKLELLTTLEC